MKQMGFYIVSLAFASLLLFIIFGIFDQVNGTAPNEPAFGLACLVVLTHFGVLVVYPLKRTKSLAKAVKFMGLISGIFMLILAGACGPTLEVRAIFTGISSQLSTVPIP